VRTALIDQADELRTFRDLATLRTAPVDPPPDGATDGSAGADAAEKLGMKRLAERLRALG
jgi:hypothetical protein